MTTNEGQATRPRILIVEDNADLLSVLEHLLSADYLVATAARGEDGVLLAGTFAPDIVLLDLQLPDMEGAEAGRRIKNSLDVPVLVLSATATAESLEALRSSGCCDAFLPKPAPIETIRAKLTELLSSVSGASE